LTSVVLSQREPRDAAVNFDRYQILHGIVRFLCHSKRSVKATIIDIIDDIIDDTDNIGPSLLRDLCPSQPQGHKFTTRNISIYGQPKHLAQSGRRYTAACIVF